MDDPLALAERTAQAVDAALAHVLRQPIEQPDGPQAQAPLKRAPICNARMPSSYSPPRPWAEWDHRWFRAAASIAKHGAGKCDIS